MTCSESQAFMCVCVFRVWVLFSFFGFERTDRSFCAIVWRVLLQLRRSLEIRK